MPWSLSRAAIYRSGRTEAAFSDGSGVVLHPSASAVASVSFFEKNGQRQRLLSTCLPQTAQIRAKVHAAAALQRRFAVRGAARICADLRAPGADLRSVGSVEQRRRCTHMVWPDASSDILQDEDGSFRITSLDASAQLSLAPHGRSYVVEWWQPNLGKHIPEEPVNVTVTPCSEFGENAHGVLCEHVRQVQCFSIEEPVQLAWLYPAFLVLTKHCANARELAQSSSSSVLLALADDLQTALAAGDLVDSGRGVTAPRPTAAAAAASAMTAADAVSPAVAMGELSEGPVSLVWTPSSIIWLHSRRPEALLQVSWSNGSKWLLMESSLKGRFWRRGPCNAQHEVSEVPEMISSDFKGPMVISGRSEAPGPVTKVFALIDEALGWLHHNANSAASGDERLPPGDMALHPEMGWQPEKEIVEGTARLTIFRSGPRRLVRLLSKTARLSFHVEAPVGGASFDHDPVDAALLALGREMRVRVVSMDGSQEEELKMVRTILAKHAKAVKLKVGQRLALAEPMRDLTNVAVQQALRQSTLLLGKLAPSSRAEGMAQCNG